VWWRRPSGIGPSILPVAFLRAGPLANAHPFLDVTHQQCPKSTPNKSAAGYSGISYQAIQTGLVVSVRLAHAYDQVARSARYPYRPLEAFGDRGAPQTEKAEVRHPQILPSHPAPGMPRQVGREDCCQEDNLRRRYVSMTSSHPNSLAAAAALPLSALKPGPRKSL